MGHHATYHLDACFTPCSINTTVSFESILAPVCRPVCLSCRLAACPLLCPVRTRHQRQSPRGQACESSRYGGPPWRRLIRLIEQLYGSLGRFQGRDALGSGQGVVDTCKYIVARVFLYVESGIQKYLRGASSPLALENFGFAMPRVCPIAPSPSPS